MCERERQSQRDEILREKRESEYEKEKNDRDSVTESLSVISSAISV